MITRGDNGAVGRGRSSKILVICTGNSARSQMAEAFLRSFDPNLDVHSAGTKPAARVHPKTISAMSEAGIDLSHAFPKDVRQFLDQAFDHVITVCDDADESCPIFQGSVGVRTHIGFPDPATAAGTEEEVLAAFRRVRDEVQRRMLEYYEREIRQQARAEHKSHEESTSRCPK